jgi:hypothetical protein
MYVITAGEPLPPLHAPDWLAPFEELVRLLCYVIPGLVLGMLAAWRPGFLGFILGLVVSCISNFPLRFDVIFSSWQLGMALESALLWSVGAMAGAFLVKRWMPNTSLERTRER